MLSFGRMRFLSVLFSVCWCLHATAQVVEISNPSKLPAKTGKFKIIGKNNDGIVVRLYGTEDVVNVYNEDMKLAFSKTLGFKNQDGLLQNILLNKTGAVVFYLTQDKKFSVLLAQPVNSKFMEMGKPVVIDTIYDHRDLVAANLRYSLSTDQNYLFIYYPFFEGSTVQTIRYICVDHALHTLYNRNVPINRNEKELYELKALVDNEGNATIALKPELAGNSEEFDVFRITKDGDLKLYSIITNRKFFGSAFLEVDDKNKALNLCAFYDDGNQKGEAVANGFFFGTYNPETGETLSERYLPFSSAFMTELTGRDMGNKNWLYTFNIRKTVLRNDGGALIIAESFIKDTRESAVPVGIQPGFNSYRESNIYQFNDIIAFSFNAKGEMEWNSIMKKKQASEDDNGAYSSFLLMNQKDKLRFLYLDDISTSGALMQYILSSDGKTERKNILNQEDHDLMFLPKLGRQLSPAEVVLPSYTNGTLQLVKISF